MSEVQLSAELARLEVAFKDDLPTQPGDIGAATAAQGTKADSAVQPAALEAVAAVADAAVTVEEIAPTVSLAASALQPVAGMGLSARSYTLAEQTKLAGMSPFGVIYGRDIGGFGDSFTANCHAIAATAFATENYGYLGQLAALSGCAFASYLNNFGVTGQNTAEFLGRVAAPLASTCKVFLFPSVTNDFTAASMTLDDTKRNVMAIIEAFTNAGKILIVGTGTPRYGDKLAAVPVGRQPDMLAYKEWVLSYVGQFVPVVNIWDDFPQSGTVDNLHPAPENALRIAKAFLPVIQSLKMRPVPVPLTALDLYSTRSPTGSQTTNPSLSVALGTGVANASANAAASPVVADGWTVVGSGSAGVVPTLTVEAGLVPGMNAQVIKLGGALTTAGGYIGFQPLANATLGNFVTGDVISFVAAYDVTGTQKGLLAVELELIVVKPVATVSTTIYYRCMDKYQTGFPIDANMSGLLETQRYTIDKTETSIRCRATLYFETTVAQDQRVAISQPALRRG